MVASVIGCTDKIVCLQVGLFGLGEQGPAEESPTAGMPKPADNKSTEPPEPFKGQPDNTQMKVQGEKSETQRDPDSSVGSAEVTTACWGLTVQPIGLEHAPQCCRPGCMLNGHICKFLLVCVSGVVPCPQSAACFGTCRSLSLRLSAADVDPVSLLPARCMHESARANWCSISAVSTGRHVDLMGKSQSLRHTHCDVGCIAHVPGQSHIAVACQ